MSEGQAKRYKDTLNLPRTAFSMKADLSQNEPKMVERWRQEDLYGRIRAARAGAPKYILHDGPPYPNGDIHLGHALNKALKDIVVKFWTMKGYDAPYVPGWDCHGLPIERKIIEELGAKAEQTPAPEIRTACARLAEKFVKIQKEQFQRLLIQGDWENPYLTMNPGYEAGIIETFNRLLQKGYVYRGLRPIHWCMECKTALAEAEIEYAEKSSPSIFVRFPAAEDMTDLFGIRRDGEVNYLIWTTTPWTLPANLAIALGEDIQYTAVECVEDGNKQYLIMADKLVDAVFQKAGKTYVKKHGSVPGADLEGMEYRHPFLERASPIILAGYVSVTDGSGCVHTAPGHGHDDYISSLKYKLPILSPVNNAGRFTFEAPAFVEGKKVFDANPAIIEHLRGQGRLFHAADIRHDYPHCWRCHQPVIFRASEQWFIAVDHDNLRKKALDAIREKIQWHPDWGATRITAMVQDRPDWCVSRQRFWGVPIPAFYCKDCGTSIATAETVGRVRDIFAVKGANCWFTLPAAELLPPGFACPDCKSVNMEKENDIFDVWFESGSSHRSVVIQNPLLRYPADVYLEGSDQHRGWFQLTLLPALAGTGEPPFKHVVTHGFTVDEQGRKHSKSLGNYIEAVTTVNQYGADVMRLLFASVNYNNDVGISIGIIQRMSDTYRNIRNRFRLLLSNLHDFQPARDAVDYAAMQEIDRWLLHRLQVLIQQADQHYTSFQFYKLYHVVYHFCEVELSAVYFEIVKDRLYADTAGDPRRRSAQTAMHAALTTLARLLAPILSYTCEEVWQTTHGTAAQAPMPSVHLERFPEANTAWIKPDLDARWTRFLQIRAEALKVLEALRNQKAIGDFLEAAVTITGTPEQLQFLRSFGDELAGLLVVSEVRLADAADDTFTPGNEVAGLAVKAAKSAHAKCQRCWNYWPDVGADAAHADLCGRCIRVTKALA